MGQVKMRLLGTGDAVGSGGRLQTCFQVEWEDHSFLIDCGASSLTAMRRFGTDPGQIELILLSHLHGDHFGGLPFFILDGQFSRRTRPLVVAGPPGVEARVRQAMEVFFPGSSQVQRKFATEFVELKEEREFLWNQIRVTPYEVIHPSGAPSYALRIEVAGKILTYSGDTEWTENLARAACGSDLFLCEGYFFEKKIKFHLDCKTILDHLSDLRCRRIILTHMKSDTLQRVQETGLEWAEDGREVLF